MPTKRHVHRHAAQISDPPYAPPGDEGVGVINLSTLLRGIRELTPEQQARLSFEADSGDARLWCTGDVDLIRRRSVAIVGTRSVSPEGAARARRLARELAQAGIVVVSGLARGVDTEALGSAIAAGGRVIAVIGTPTSGRLDRDSGTGGSVARKPVEVFGGSVMTLGTLRKPHGATPPDTRQYSPDGIPASAPDVKKTANLAFFCVQP